MNKRSIIIFSLIIIAFGLGYFGGQIFPINKYNNTENKSNTNKKNSINPTIKKDEKYDLLKFSQIKIGMTYNQVKDILGDGENEKIINIDDSSSTPYIWENEDGSFIEIYFLQNKVFKKVQSNLDNSMDVKVTKEEFSKIKRGMTYDEVKAILGEGQLIGQMQGSSTVNNESYEWINSDKSYVEIIFQEGRLISKYMDRFK